ncbi:EexN family lipoprotein [Phenylobacterium sp.]|uniref:EexN family lipoprotein n=1 Tax=Phenylobacterium sp. TaxID=1871053 RepID=UPI00345C166B
MRPLALLVLTTMLCGCERSATYFAENPAVAKEVLEDCKRGAHRGPECQNAQAAEANARHEAAQSVWRSMQQPTNQGSDPRQDR